MHLKMAVAALAMNSSTGCAQKSKNVFEYFATVQKVCNGMNVIRMYYIGHCCHCQVTYSVVVLHYCYSQILYSGLIG